jgi:hypothetical protein
MPGGRPTTWSKALEKKAWQYVNGGWEEQGDRTPSVVGLCGYINRSRRVIYKWAKHEDKQFVHILDSVSEKQEAELLKHGLSGDFNSTITKLMLTKHGYHDKQDQTIAGHDGGAIKTDNKYTIEFVNADDNPIINAESKD